MLNKSCYVKGAKECQDWKQDKQRLPDSPVLRPNMEKECQCDRECRCEQSSSIKVFWKDEEPLFRL